MFVCIGVHINELKLKEAVRFRGLCIFLPKKRGFGLQGMINCGEVSSKYMEEQMEDKVYFMQLNLVSTPHLQ